MARRNRSEHDCAHRPRLHRGLARLLRFSPLVLFSASPDNHEDQGDKCRKHNSPEPKQAFDLVQKWEIRAKLVAEHAVEQRPGDTPGSIKDQELWPVHAVGARKKRRPCTKYGNKAPEEDSAITVPIEERLRLLHVLGANTDVLPVLLDQSTPALTSRQIPRVISEDGARCCRENYATDPEVAGSCVDGTGHEHRLPGNGNPGRLDRNRKEHRKVPPGTEQVRKGGGV